MQRYAVVMPVGPLDPVASAMDTVESVATYLEPRHTRLVVIDDTGGPELRDALADEARIRVDVRASVVRGGSGIRGGLCRNVLDALQHVVTAYDPDIVLRLDVDALAVGEGLWQAAEPAFEADLALGALGSYRLTAGGERRDFGPVAAGIEHDLAGRRPPWRWKRTLRRMLNVATANGYEAGEHALAAGTLLSKPCLHSLLRGGWLRAPGVETSTLGDDHLLGVLVYAAGFRLGDFGGPGQPMGLAWRGLPMSPAELVDEGKLLIHSVKDYNDQRERAVRDYFKVRRHGG